MRPYAALSARYSRTRAIASVRRAKALSTLASTAPAPARPTVKRSHSAASNAARSSGETRCSDERAVELEDVVDDVLGAVGEQVDAAGVPLDDPGGELVARGVGHHPGVGLVPQP